MKANDTGLKTDVAILDFSKFDTVTHNKLLSKMDSYGIRGPIKNWLNMFLPQRKMKAVVEGEQSEEVVVDSGAVRDSSWIVLFLCCTNNLPYAVKSTIRLLTDDFLLYRTIKSTKEHSGYLNITTTTTVGIISNLRVNLGNCNCSIPEQGCLVVLKGATISMPTGRHIDNDFIPDLKTNSDLYCIFLFFS